MNSDICWRSHHSRDVFGFLQQGSSSKSKRLSKSTHDMLVEIFKKIGSKENTKEVVYVDVHTVCCLAEVAFMITQPTPNTLRTSPKVTMCVCVCESACMLACVCVCALCKNKTQKLPPLFPPSRQSSIHSKQLFPSRSNKLRYLFALHGLIKSADVEAEKKMLPLGRLKTVKMIWETT